MDFRPEHLLATAGMVVAVAGGLAFGGATLASAQESDDTGTTDTTIQADDGTTTDDGTTAEDGGREDCPLGADGAPAEGDASASSTSVDA